MLVKVAPLVHTKKLTYLFPFIVIGYHGLLQLIFSCTNEHLNTK